MAVVFIPSQLRGMTGGVDQIDVQGRTVGDLVAAVDARYPGIAARLVSGDSLAPGLAVSVDGSFSSRGVLAPVGPESEVHFLPAIGGG